MGAKKLVPVKDLKKDTYYDAPLWLDENYILLTPDIPVTQQLITDLQNWGFKSVMTEGSMVAGGKAAVDMDSTISGATLNNNAKEQEGRNKARKFFNELVIYIQKVYDKFDRDGDLNIGSITEEVKKVIEMIKENRVYILRLPDLKADGIDYLYTHSARTMIIALSIGIKMKLPTFRLIELGISTMLHEIGMVKIPKTVYEKTTPLTENDKKLIATHPSLGFKLLQNYSKTNTTPLSMDILMGVWQHHERSNGTGYPKGLTDESITLFGKIIAVACSYDAQISNRPWREGINGYTIIMSMLKSMNSFYDKNVITALLMSISLYSIGNYVRLKKGSIGIVVDTGSKDPRYPVVKLLLDEEMHIYKEQPVIQTTPDKPEMTIEGVFSKEEVEEMKEKGLLPS